MLLDPRNGPAWDLPPSAAPLRPFIIASSPRTGSTLLARLLWDTHRAGAPKEYLNPMQLRDWGVRFGEPMQRLAYGLLRGPATGVAGRVFVNQRDIHTHMQRVIAHRTGQDGLFGLKLHYHHYLQWCAAPDSATPAQLLGAEPVWIHILRQDKLAQAISWDKALQSGRWASTQGRGLPTRYSRRRIDAALARIAAQEQGWEHAMSGKPVLTLSYEALTAERTQTLARALAWIGAEPMDRLPPDPIQRQADHRSLSWAARYRQGL